METLLARLLPIALYNELYKECKDLSCLTELRLRRDKPLYFAINGIYKKLSEEYTVSGEDISYILSAATKSSLYAYNSSILEGYISYDGGIRIGLSGEGVLKNGTLSAVKNINSLCIRLPHFVTINDSRLNSLIDDFDNTLIISKPGYGKTTLLRYMIKRLSDKGYNVLVLDERGELSGASQGKFYVDLGECCDVALGIPKLKAYESQVRSMRPDIIASDEIFGESEVDCIADCVRCGVKVIATLHGSALDTVNRMNIYDRLLGYMRYAVLIKDIGNIGRIVDLKGKYA